MDPTARAVVIVGILVAGVVLYFSQSQDAKSASETPPAAVTSSGGAVNLTGFPAKFDHHLVAVENGRFKPFDASALKDVKYYAFYYSASWCPPCRAFTPKLVDFYKEFKPQHPNFELVFVNHDQSEDKMLAYMAGDSMTWPAIRFDDIEKMAANRFCGPGIPDLVLVDAGGAVLSDSFSGDQYLGPYKVIDDIKRLVTP
jgi:nucleoredoxin